MVSSGSSNSLAMASTVPGEAGPIGRWGGCIIPGAPPAGCGGGTLGKLKRYKQSCIITHKLDCPGLISKLSSRVLELWMAMSNNNNYE